MHNTRPASASIKSSFITSAMLFFLFGTVSPAIAQLDGAYYDNTNYHLFTEDGLYQFYDIENDDVRTGSYRLSNGVLLFYDEDGNLASKVNATTTRTGLTLSSGGESYRMKYVCTAEEFLALALLGAIGTLIDK